MAEPSPDLQRAIEELQRGVSREENFRHLFRHYRRRVMGFFARRGFSPEDCCDLTQETFLGIYTNIGSFRHEACFETWLFKIAVNVYRKHLRRRAADKRAGAEIPLESRAEDEGVPLANRLAEDPERWPPPEATVLGKERSERLRRAVGELPEQMRRCLVLRLYQELQYKEIAAVMQVSIDTVKAHLFQARQRLKDRLAEEAPPQGVRAPRSSS